ncbi:MAG TPA: hypothetical protein VK805_11155 [Candidatus Baltobacteraceae bacterium]|nr:hypothetical protein [Candidatus Baltobacteraceae bacterium]
MLTGRITRLTDARRNRRLAACAVFSLALVSVFFLLQVVPHSHSSGHDEPNCRLCQVAHLGVAPTVSVTLLSLILLFFGEILVPLCPHFAEPFSTHSPSRAPPALIA